MSNNSGTYCHTSLYSVTCEVLHMLRIPVGHLSTVNTTLRQAPGLSAKTARCHFCQAKKNDTT